MEKTSIYGTHLDEMTAVMNLLVERIKQGAAEIKKETGISPIEHLKCRIKTEESMREKCRRDGIEENEHSALRCIHDAIGIRVVCSFLDDIYAIREYISKQKDIEIFNEKDFIKNVKPNGYRSYHMIVIIGGYFAEIQIRTISMDTWAALEHHIRYKKSIGGNTALIFEELKRCADELASTDVSMQTIRNMINEG